MPEQNFADLIGAVATLLAVSSLVPQVVKTWRTRSTRDLSASWLIIAFASMVLWVAYGTLVAAWAIIVANAATLVLVIALLAMKLRFTEGRSHG